MWAVDDTGNGVMMFRQASGKGRRAPVEVSVHPDWPLSDPLLLVVVVASSFLREFFRTGGGG